MSITALSALFAFSCTISNSNRDESAARKAIASLEKANESVDIFPFNILTLLDLTEFSKTLPSRLMDDSHGDVVGV